MTTTGHTKLYIPVRHERGEGSALMDNHAHFDRATAEAIAQKARYSPLFVTDVTEILEVELAEDEIPALTELREAVTALHAYLYPERYPRELQPDHSFWQRYTEEAAHEGACYEWSGGDNLEAVAETLESLVKSFPKPPPPPKDYTMPGTTSGLMLTLLTNELENAEEDLREVENQPPRNATRLADAIDRRDAAQEALDAFRSQFS